MDKKIWHQNGFVTRFFYGLIGALMILALSALTALPIIGNNTAAIERNSDDIIKIEERLLDVATREDLNRLEDNLRGYMKDLLKTDGGQ